jgi:hypothetical protein
MIPRIIHYCWFGGNPLPQSAQRCIASWRKFMPDCEIREWNEQNFDVNAHPYTRAAYAAGKYAFVSDFARYKILEEWGGIYFDTDVEAVAPISDLLQLGAFMGLEDAQPPTVSSGLVMAVEAHHPIIQEMLEFYDAQAKDDSTAMLDTGIVVSGMTEIFIRHGFVRENRYQEVAGVALYPSEYFDPMDNATGRIKQTPNTRTIHRYDRTWSAQKPLYIWLSRLWHRSWLYRLIK